MMESPEFYSELVRRYADGLCDEAELEVFFGLMAEGRLDGVLRLEMDRATGIPEKEWKEEEEVMAGMTERESEKQGEVTEKEWTEHAAVMEGKTGMLVRRLVWRRWLVAAAILLVVGGAYLLQRKSSAPVQDTSRGAVSSDTRDVPPGGEKAILTLSGGRQLVLDGQHEDTVLTEGAAVVAGSKGRLAYNAGKGGDLVVTYNTLSTPRGGKYQLTLPDGTVVWLNAASSITYPTAFTGRDRVVEMTGEAYFEVSKNAAKPFKVRMGDREIDVLGTSFNVNGYVDEPAVRVTLIEGGVEVREGERVQQLRPAEQAVLTGGAVRLIRHADIEQAIAWKNGRFAFTDADIQTVMRQLSRWYDVTVSYEGIVPKRQFNGKLSQQLTLDQVLQILSNHKIRYTIETEKRLVIRP